MIIFCEDCSSKNYLEDEKAQDDVLVFRCRSCNYLNTIRQKPKTGSPFDKGSDWMNALGSAPQIVGAFLFHTQKGIIHNNMPKTLRVQDLQKIGKIMFSNFETCLPVLEDITRQVMVIQDKNLIFQKITSASGVILVSTKLPLGADIDALLDPANFKRMELLL